MNLFKWTKNIKPKFPNFIEKFLGNKIDEHTTPTEEVATVPSVNINEKNKAFEVAVALPGLEKDDVRIEVTDQRLVISSEKQYEKEENKGYWLRREYGYASFQRIFQLPNAADENQVKAEMKNGVLSIKVGKKKDYSDKVKTIEVV